MRLLCQDCLSFKDYSEKEINLYFKDNYSITCECGGDLCHCNSCMASGNKLMNNDFSDFPNIKVYSWSSEKGLIKYDKLNKTHCSCGNEIEKNLIDITDNLCFDCFEKTHSDNDIQNLFKYLDFISPV